jgi:hypothetical protein
MAWLIRHNLAELYEKNPSICRLQVLTDGKLYA